MKKAVIIVPTYNEKDSIEATIEALAEVFKKIKDWKMEILVVDDTSPDGTHKVVKKLQKKYKFLYLVLNKTKAGLGGAYLKGMDEAFNKHKADVVFEFDADLSHDPLKIPDFLVKIDRGSDMVIGSRYISGGGIPEDWGLHRKFLSVVGNFIIMVVLTDFRIRDWTSGFRAITKKVYEAVHKELAGGRFTGYTFQIGFLHKAVRRKFKITEVPFRFVDRTHGQSKLGPEYIKNTLLYIFKVRLMEILDSRIFKFAFVGGIGAIIQLSSLQLFRLLLGGTGLFFITAFQLASFLSIETAITSNFFLNNLWTFADRKLELARMPFKFIQFNITSAGSIIIQLIVATLGERFIGLFELFKVPVVGFSVDTGIVFAIVGILLGLSWNFFAYTRIIWKKK